MTSRSSSSVRRLGAVVASAALAGAALVAAPSSAYAVADSTNPVLTAASRTTPGTVGGNAPVTVQVSASDAGGSHLGVVRVVYLSAAGREFDAVVDYSGQALDSVSGSAGAVSATTSQWLANGDYAVARIEVSDGDGNKVSYNRDGSITQGISDIGSHTLTLSSLDVTVSNPSSDATAPRVTSIKLANSPATVQAGDPILLAFSATDTVSGLEDLQAVYYSPDSSQPVYVITPPEYGYGAVTGIASGVVPASLEGGSYRLSYILVRDRAGNGTYYETGTPDTVRTDPAGLAQPPALDLHALGVTTVTVAQPGGADVTAPQLTSFSLRPGSSARHLGEFATFAYAISDSSPVTALRVFLRDPDGRQVIGTKLCGPITSGKLSFWFPPDVATGRWDVTGVGIQDSAGNLRNYGPDGVGEQIGRPSHQGPVFTDMHVDVTAGDIRQDPEKVDDTCADPVVTSATSARYVRSGSAVDVTGKVSWNGVAVARPWVALFSGQGASARYVGVTRGTSSGTYSLRATVRSSTVLRAYFLGSGRVGAAATLGSPLTVSVGKYAKVTARDTSIRLPRGAKRTLSAYVSPRRSGVTVTLQRKTSSGTWVVVTTKRSNAKGNVSYRVSRRSYYRWTTAYAGGYLPATSRTIRVSR